MPEPDSSRTGKHFDVLDGLRGVAAMLVLLGHASSIMLGPAHTFVDRKKLAVLFFFMLSGFVVASAYQTRFRRGYRTRDFLLRRAIRLYPMIIAGSVLAIATCACFEPAYRPGWRTFGASVAAIVCLPCPHTDFDPWTKFPVNPPEWSLFYEGFAYLVFALLLSRLSSAVLAVVVVLTVAIYSRTDFADVTGEVPFALLSFAAIAGFGFGVLLFRLHDAGRLPPVPMPFGMLAFLIVATCAMPARYGSWPNVVAFIVVYPLVIAAGASHGRRDATVLERMLGELSFPVYVVHWPCLVLARDVVGPRAGAAAAMAVGITVAIGVAFALCRLYDEPARRFLLAALRSWENRRDERLPIAAARPER